MRLDLLDAGGDDAAPTSAPSAAPLELAGTSWSLIEYAAPSGEIFTVPAAVTPTAEFTADTMSGRAGCNTFTAGYTLDGDNFTLTGISSTMMACEGPVATVETAYLQALAVLDKAALLDDGRLQLWDARGQDDARVRPGGLSRDAAGRCGAGRRTWVHPRERVRLRRCGGPA